MNFCVRRSLREVEHLDAHDVILLVVIHDDAGRDFLGTARGRIAQAQVQGVGLLVHFEPHGIVLLRSKNAVTIRGGVYPTVETVSQVRSWFDKLTTNRTRINSNQSINRSS